MKIINHWDKRKGVFIKTGIMNTIFGEVQIEAVAKCAEEDRCRLSKEIGDTECQYTFNKKALRMKIKEQRIKYKICKDFAESIKQKKAVPEETRKYIDKLLGNMERDICFLTDMLKQQDKDRKIFEDEIRLIEKKIKEKKNEPIEIVPQEEILSVLSLFDKSSSKE